jgi:predicted ATPase
MATMKVETLSLKNYKSFKKLHMSDLTNLAFFVGANGAGKTTLFDVFGFLKDALTKNVRQAIQIRGGFHELISRDAADDESIEIELQFRMDIAEKSRLVTYHLELKLEEGLPVIAREILRYKRGEYGAPFRFLDFSKGSGYAITNEEDSTKLDSELTRENQTLSSQDTLAIKGLGQFARFKAASAFRELIENWHVSDFHIEAARQVQDTGYAEHLSESGDNLPQVTKYMYDFHRATFDKVLAKMQERVPGVESVAATDTVDGRIVLRFYDGSFKEPFIGRYVSDGTIKMFAYLLLLHDPRPHPLLCIEEPENQLYPALLPELAEELRSYADKGGQVFVSSHSPDLLNAARIQEVFWLSKRDGKTSVSHASDDEQIVSLVKEGDELGALWNQGFFGGADPRSI